MTFGGLAKSADQVDGAFDRATKAAIDLAAAGFGNATSNAIQLGKALNDPIKGLTSLTKSGVTFTESERERIKVLVESNKLGEAQALILAAIEQQVGGTAEATVTSSAKMEAAFGQIEDAVGLALLPVLDKFSAWISTQEGQETIQEIADAASDLFGKLVDVVDFALANKNWLVPMAAGIAVMAGAVTTINGIKAAIDAAKLAQIQFNTQVSKNPWVTAGVIATAAIPAVIDYSTNPEIHDETLDILADRSRNALPNMTGSPGTVNITVNTPKLTAAEITNLVNNAQKNGYTGQITIPRSR
jgi:hypothetical protein